MKNNVHVDTNVSRETGSTRQRARRGTTKCPHCDQPRLEGHAYCRQHHAAYQKAWRAKERARIKALEAAAGVSGGWVEPA
jgi:hypothetical protein